MQIENIISVVAVERKNLTQYIKMARGVYKVEDVGHIKINIKVPARLEMTTEEKDNEVLSSYELTFETKDKLIGNRLVFIAKTANGVEYILGTPYRPYNHVTKTRVLADDLNSSQLWKVTVKRSFLGDIAVMA